MRVVLLVLLATLGVTAAAAVPAGAEVVWLCKPGLADDPCQIAQDTTIREPGGKEQVENPAATAAPKVDCFYVYPTVSNQVTANANKARDPEIKSIAKYQAARFNRQCRVFAPIYRQATLASIGTGYASASGADRNLAFGDVLEAWRAYLQNDNGGRGVVLVGHSQGTFMLRELLRREIEVHPSQLRRLISALLIGGNVTVEPDRLLGGDFRLTPLCTRRAQVACAVAFSTFAQDPPSNSRFGRTATKTAAGGRLDVACTDPRPLAGVTDPFRVLVPTEPYAPGPIAAGVAVVNGGLPPTAPTTWVIPADRYSGGCTSINGAHVLRIAPIGASKQPNPFPEPTWGTHLLDVNLAYEPLVSLVTQQAERWTRPRLRLTRRCVAGGRLRVRLDGPEAEWVRDVNFKLARRLVARDTSAAFERTVGRAALDRTTARRLRAVVYLKSGPERVILSRSLPQCGPR